MSTVRERAARALSHTALALHPNPGPQRDAMVREALDAVLAVVANVGEIAAVMRAHDPQRMSCANHYGGGCCPSPGCLHKMPSLEAAYRHQAEAVVAHILDAS